MMILVLVLVILSGDVEGDANCSPTKGVRRAVFETAVHPPDGTPWRVTDCYRIGLNGDSESDLPVGAERRNFSQPSRNQKHASFSQPSRNPTNASFSRIKPQTVTLRKNSSRAKSATTAGPTLSMPRMRHCRAESQLRLVIHGTGASSSSLSLPTTVVSAFVGQRETKASQSVDLPMACR